MNESRLNDDTLTTADIAGRPAARTAAMDRSLDQADSQPILLPAASPVAGTAAGNPGPLFPEVELHNLRARWDSVQTSFVDEPRQAVEQADSLVANVVKRIAEQFSVERAKLEDQWAKGDNVSTEDLRQSLKRYHSFFDRLLSF